MTPTATRPDAAPRTRQSAPDLRAASLASLPPPIRRKFLKKLTAREARLLSEDWRFWARDDQLAPDGPWTTWLVLGGRGAGKTRAGAEWVAGEVAAGRAGRIALVGETLGDAREVMIDGPSGLRTIARADDRPRSTWREMLSMWPGRRSC